jgi:hypothetical protein
MPYSDFKTFKGRPVLVFKVLDKQDFLVLPLTTNLQRDGIVIDKSDIVQGSLKKKSVVIVPKLTAIDAGLIREHNLIAVLKDKSFQRVTDEICHRFACLEKKREDEIR